MEQVDASSIRRSSPVDPLPYAFLVLSGEITLDDVPEELYEEVFTLMQTIYCPECG